MVKNITRRLSLTTTSAIALAMILVGQVAVLAVPCRKPNENTVGCTAFPGDSVSDCSLINPAQNQASCSGAKEYQITLYPDGGADSATGVTKQEMYDCMRLTPCKFDVDLIQCASDPANTSAFSQGAATINDSTKTCPTPG